MTDNGEDVLAGLRAEDGHVSEDYDAEERWHWWVQLGDGEPHEVTREEWIAAERAAGFCRKGGGEGPATQSWGNGWMKGYRTLRDPAE